MLECGSSCSSGSGSGKGRRQNKDDEEGGMELHSIIEEEEGRRSSSMIETENNNTDMQNNDVFDFGEFLFLFVFGLDNLLVCFVALYSIRSFSLDICFYFIRLSILHIKHPRRNLSGELFTTLCLTPGK